MLNCCSQHSLFIVEILIIERIRISLYDVSDIHILLCSELVRRRVKIPRNVLVVSPLFQPDYRFWFENEVKVYEFVLRNGY